MKYISLLLLVLSIWSCETSNYESAVPLEEFPPVHLDLLDDEFINFTIGSTMALSEEYGGYGGFILHYTPQGTINAYDRCCPRHVEEKELLEYDGALAMCPTDSVYYSLLEQPSYEMGSNAPSLLRHYRTSKDGYHLQITYIP